MNKEHPGSLDAAELQAFIAEQQEAAASLERAGNKKAARAARARLYPLLHRLDLLQLHKAPEVGS